MKGRIQMKLIDLTRAPVLVALVIATAALFAMVSGCKPDADAAQEVAVTDADTGRIIEGTTANFKSEVLQSELPVLVDFGADWCAPCRGIHPNLVAIAAEYSGRCKVVSVDVDKAGALAQRYGVRGIPMLVLIVDGRKADGRVGYQTVPQLRTLLDKHVK
jgi:thioredoxin 1